jgi:pyrroline-5-carboxylate reductase
VKATLQGAARLAAGDEDPTDLRAAVTSKGGTTAAAIARLEERGFRMAMNEAIAAATMRGRELDSEVTS